MSEYTEPRLKIVLEAKGLVLSVREPFSLL